MKLLGLLTLKKEAHLFDTKEYLLKVFVAVLIGYFVGRSNSLLSKDMISLLFGMMFTLEPVNTTGIKAGVKQIQASILGAIITGVIVAIFGYNILTIAIGITATVYVSLLIDWKQVSVVAVFTSIYMTQLVQFNALGEPSELLTFRLRILALGAGVLVAFFVNFIFSIIGYRKMILKRFYYVMNQLVEKMTAVNIGLEDEDIDSIKKTMNELPEMFNSIDWIKFTLLDIGKDRRLLKNLYKNTDIDIMTEEVELLRGMTHVIYDMCYQIQLYQSVGRFKGDPCYNKVIEQAIIMSKLMEKKINKTSKEAIIYEPVNVSTTRNVEQLNKSLNRLYELIGDNEA